MVRGERDSFRLLPPTRQPHGQTGKNRLVDAGDETAIDLELIARGDRKVLVLVNGKREAGGRPRTPRHAESVARDNILALEGDEGAHRGFFGRRERGRRAVNRMESGVLRILVRHVLVGRVAHTQTAVDQQLGGERVRSCAQHLQILASHLHLRFAQLHQSHRLPGRVARDRRSLTDDHEFLLLDRLRDAPRLARDPEGRFARGQPLEGSPAPQLRDVAAVQVAVLVSREQVVVGRVSAGRDIVIDEVIVGSTGIGVQLRAVASGLNVLSVPVARGAPDFSAVSQTGVAHSEGGRRIERVAVHPRAIGRIVGVEIINVARPAARRDRPRTAQPAIFEAQRRSNVEALVVRRICHLPRVVAVRVVPADAEAGPDAQRADVEAFADHRGNVLHRLDTFACRDHAEQWRPVCLRADPPGPEDRIGDGCRRCVDAALRRR